MRARTNRRSRFPSARRAERSSRSPPTERAGRLPHDPRHSGRRRRGRDGRPPVSGGVVPPDRPRAAPMESINRALWWRRTHPEVAAEARWLMNWHEFYSLLLTGRPVVDWSDAGTWGPGCRDRRLVAGPHCRDRHRSQMAARGPAERNAHRDDPARGGHRAGPAPRYAGRDRCLRHLRRLGGLRCRPSRGRSPGVRDVGLVQSPGLPGWAPELVHDGFMSFLTRPDGFWSAVPDPNGMNVIDWFRSSLISHSGVRRGPGRCRPRARSRVRRCRVHAAPSRFGRGGVRRHVLRA